MKTGKMVILAVVFFTGTNLFAVTLPFEDGFENISVGDYPDENGWQNLFDGETAYVWYDPSTAKNNEIIAYGREVTGGVTSSREIYLLDPITMAETRLTNNSWEEGWPAISPDGKKVAYTSKQDGNHEIYIMNIDGTDPNRITFDPAADGGVSWSTDGVYIAFQSDRDGNAEIYIVKADKTELPVNISNNSATDADPYWSPDGKHIIFVSDRDGNQDVWVMDRDGSNPQNLTNHAGIDGAPAYSPNGDNIAFMSDRDGNREIYVMCYDGSNQTRLTNSSTWEENPDWSPDGKEIVYHSHQYGANIWKMNPDGTSQTRLTTFSGDTWPSWGAELEGKSFRLVSKPNWSRTDYVALSEVPDRFTYEVSVYADPVAGRTVWVGFVEQSGSYGLCYNRFQIKNIDGTNGEVYFNTGIGGDPSLLLGGFTIGEWVTVRADLDFVNLTADLWLNDELKTSDVIITSKEFDDPTWGHIILNKWGVTEYNWGGSGTGVIYIDDVKLDYTGNLIKNGDFTYELDNWVFVDKCQNPFGHNTAWVEDGKLWIESYKSGYGPGYVVQVLDRYVLPKRFRIEYHQVIGQGCGGIGFGLDSGGIDELHNTGKPLTYWVGEHDADGDYAYLRVCEDNPHLIMATHDTSYELGIFEAIFNYDNMEIYVSVTCSSGTHYATVPISSFECALTNAVWACAVNPCSDGRNYETATFDKIILEGYEISQEYHVNSQGGNDSWSGISPICESPDGPKKTIQAGIDATLYKDTVLVWPGVYVEDVSFLGKAITVASADDAAHIVADGLYAVSFINGEDSGSVLENFVIRDSNTGIQCVASDPTIQFVTVANCEQGIWADQGANPSISNSILWDNANGDLINTTASDSYAKDLNSHFVMKFGSGPGSGDEQFNQPQNLIEDSVGRLYVCDRQNNRIKIIDKNGDYVGQWGSSGSGDGQFSWPVDIAFDSLGFAYVADHLNQRIQKFRYDGTWNYVSQWGSYGTGDGQFDDPTGIAIDSSDYVYVVDEQNHRVQKFTSDGTFVTKWGSNGNGDGQFKYPIDIAIDQSGDVYVTDHQNNRVQKFMSDGTYILQWGSSGSGNGQFQWPMGVDVDMYGNVLVVDHHNYRIQVFTNSGDFITKWGSYGSDDVQFNNPMGVHVGSQGYIYVADMDNHRIQKFGHPFFADPAGSDYHLQSERGRYQPVDPNHPVEGYWLLDEVTSPCIDAGDPSIDASEEPSPNGEIVNIGAYGGTAYASRSMAAERRGLWSLVGDLNYDRIVNLLDLGIMAENWLKEIED